MAWTVATALTTEAKNSRLLCMSGMPCMHRASRGNARSCAYDRDRMSVAGIGRRIERDRFVASERKEHRGGDGHRVWVIGGSADVIAALDAGPDILNGYRERV